MGATQQPGRNWAGNVTYSAAELRRPGSVEELAEIIASEPRVRMLGSRHSFNDLADTDGTLISLADIPESAQVGDGFVRVPAGLRYGDLVPVLAEAELALANLASLPHISVAGAVQTGTHGSGDRAGTLATQVRAIELIAGTGETVRLDRGDEDFAGAVVGLGALGAVTALELDTVPARAVRQSVYEGATWDRVLADLTAVTSSGDSVSLFTSWRDADAIDGVWVKSAEGTADARDRLEAVGARPADGPRHPIPGADPEPATEQGGVLGPWYDRLPHFRLAFTPSVGAEVQSEYLVARTDAVAAIEALRTLAPRIAPLLHVCEVRTMAADQLWLSAAEGRDTVGLHFTWRLDPDGIAALLPDLEAALPSSARPHWGKAFSFGASDIRERWARVDEFRALRARFDPQGRFHNRYLERLGL